MSKKLVPHRLPTGAQFEILELLSAQPDGMTPADVWGAMQSIRPVSRPTVMTLLQRLEERGWIQRLDEGRSSRFVLLHRLEKASGSLAQNFLNRFFGGSPSKMVLSLLGDQQISKEELRRVREILDAAEKANQKEDSTC